jgi:glycerol-3-phosphate O-acyltransferase
VAEVDGRGLPVARSFDQLRDREGLRRVAGSLAANKTIRRHDSGTEEVFAVEEGQHHAAAFYRNTIVHAFVVRAITEVALVRAGRETERPVDAFWVQALELRDLLKFEFFFADREDFCAQVREVVALLFPEWEARLGSGEDLARELAPPVAPMVLRSFLEADAVLAHSLAGQSAVREVTSAELGPTFMGIGEQFVLQRRVVCPESVSTLLFATAFRLAEHRELTAAGVDVAARRIAFAVEVDRLLDCVAWLERRSAEWLEGVV